MEAIRARKPDLVLTDVMMPGLDGFGLLRELTEVSRLGRVGGRNALKSLVRHPEGRHYRGSAAWAEVILGGGS